MSEATKEATDGIANSARAAGRPGRKGPVPTFPGHDQSVKPKTPPSKYTVMQRIERLLNSLSSADRSAVMHFLIESDRQSRVVHLQQSAPMGNFYNARPGD